MSLRNLWSFKVTTWDQDMPQPDGNFPSNTRDTFTWSYVKKMYIHMKCFKSDILIFSLSPGKEDIYGLKYLIRIIHVTQSFILWLIQKHICPYSILRIFWPHKQEELCKLHSNKDSKQNKTNKKTPQNNNKNHHTGISKHVKQKMMQLI